MEDPLTLTHDRRTELLAGCRLFSGVAQPDLAAVAGRAIEVDFPANHVIARQARSGRVLPDRVRLGEGRARRRGRGPGAGRLLRRAVRPRRAARTAQVVAREPTRCLGLASWDFEQALLESPTLALSILRGLAGRLRSVTEQQHH
jgi:hypothetical protein